MSLSRQSFRHWWQIPRKAGDPHKDRRVSFLELFYDLVYVVLISQISHTLSENISLAGIGSYIFLFVLVCSAWINGTWYYDLHGRNDLRTRVFTFLQMFTVVFMSVFVHNAIGEGSFGFALSYSAFMLILTYMWWRTGVYDPNHRPISHPYSLIFLISATLFIISVFVRTPWRFYIWGFTLLITVLNPLITLVLVKNNPKAQAELLLTYSFSPALVERFGLFTIIVLGEVIVSVVVGVVGLHYINLSVSLTVTLGMLIAIEIWWIYFDFISHHLPITNQRTRFGWLYLQPTMTMGISATGAGILNAIVHSGDSLSFAVRWLLVGSIAVALISIAFLMRIIQILKEHQRAYRIGSSVTLISGIIILLLGFINLNTVFLLIIIILIMIAPVSCGLKTFIGSLDEKEYVN